MRSWISSVMQPGAEFFRTKQRAKIVGVRNDDPLPRSTPMQPPESRGIRPAGGGKPGNTAIRQQVRHIFGCDPVGWGDRCARPLTILALWGKLGV